MVACRHATRLKLRRRTVDSFSTYSATFEVGVATEMTRASDATANETQADAMRLISRTPHPYHCHNHELLEPADRLVCGPASSALPTTTTLPTMMAMFPPPQRLAFAKETTPAASGCESGTDADDEHLIKGLPAPKAKLHKGLRGKNEPLSGLSTPHLSPAVLEEEGRRPGSPVKQNRDVLKKDKRATEETMRRRREILRRATELGLLVTQAVLVQSKKEVRPLLASYRHAFIAQGTIVLVLGLLYPIRLIVWGYGYRSPSRRIPVTSPCSFDPAPMLYPLAIPILVSLLAAANLKGVVLPNLVLSICTIPRPLVPGAHHLETHNYLHWALSCVPLLVSHLGTYPETLVLLYPLHQSLCFTLHLLTTTSLLTAELQLLSVSLINLFLMAQSPQAVILKALLWGGGIGTIISCGPVVRWGVALARVPKWRFRTPAMSTEAGARRSLKHAWRTARRDFGFSDLTESTWDPANSSDQGLSRTQTRVKLRSGSASTLFHPMGGASPLAARVRDDEAGEGGGKARPELTDRASWTRRHTLPSLDRPEQAQMSRNSKTHTPSGRRKRYKSSTARAYFALTQAQATMRKWLYAAWVHICVLAIVLVGIRAYVQRQALGGHEPLGWALAYLLADLPWFRLQVVGANLERWICLPARPEGGEYSSVRTLGWLQHARFVLLGPANTRLLMSGYFICVIVVGLAVVFRLSPIYEVDTRRKVFHFMMVAMFLPATFVDPGFVALALALVLAVFLLLDLLRASQLPPLSKPIARFLTPYVDGRDLRGPVVVSHIFLLIGCAIPLWLSLASLPRLLAEEASACSSGWEMPARETAMVSGVVCVGLGDAAASLIGRRFGHRKWFWGGGKSLEGSAAFATAVFAGLMAARMWLKIGDWATVEAAALPSAVNLSDWLVAARDAGLCASVASMTEAVLTGGNDNVVVPVVLWTCVKGLGI